MICKQAAFVAVSKDLQRPSQGARVSAAPSRFRLEIDQIDPAIARVISGDRNVFDASDSSYR